MNVYQIKYMETILVVIAIDFEQALAKGKAKMHEIYKNNAYPAEEAYVEVRGIERIASDVVM